MITSRRMRWSGNVARVGEEECIQSFYLGKPKGKTPLGRHIHRWEDNIRMNLRKIGLRGIEWIHLAYDRDRWRVHEHGSEPSGSIKL
jgi:hypothetical protein